MEEDLNKKLRENKLPSSLQSRQGWGDLFELKRSPWPHLHQIEPTNACPYKCIMCPRGKAMNRKIGFMDKKIFRKVIDEVSEYPEPVKNKEIELFHFGESLLHPDIMWMSSYASSKGLNTVLSVNAPELTEILSEDLIKGGLRKLIVSLDGYDAESFYKIRGKRIDYQNAIDKIERASLLIKKFTSHTKLVVRMISLNLNAPKTDEFLSFWKEKNIEAEIRQFFPWGEKEMKDLGHYDKFPPFMPCPFAWQYVVVQWNGDVVACCRDYNAVNVMGNVNDSSLKEIWNGKNYTRFREDMISGEYRNSICPPCMDLYYSET